MGGASIEATTIFAHFLALTLALVQTHGFSNLAAPERLLWALVILKQRSAEEASGTWTGAHEDAFRCCTRRAPTVISNADLSSVAPALTTFRLILMIGA